MPRRLPATAAVLSVLLAGCGGAPDVPLPEPMVVRVPCVSEELVSDECRPTPDTVPKTRVELEEAHDELGVSNSACYAIVVEYAAGIAECKGRRGEKDSWLQLP